MARGWTTIGVPVELRDRIKRLAEKKGVALWEIIADILSFYESKMKEGMGDKSGNGEIDLQKVAYYIMKLSFSVSVFKLEPSVENYKKLIETVEQIEQRLKVDLGTLKKAADLYKRVKDKQSTYTLNMAWKSAIMALMALICG